MTLERASSDREPGTVEPKPAAKLRFRRARRTDFTAVMSLLAGCGIAVPPPDRATLRRFRNLVADLGGDFYVASFDETLAGLVHVTYARQLTTGPAARVDQLVVAERYRRRGIGSGLLAFAQTRARKRGCATFRCALPGKVPTCPFLETAGMRSKGDWFALDLQPGEDG